MRKDRPDLARTAKRMAGFEKLLFRISADLAKRPASFASRVMEHALPTLRRELGATRATLWKMGEDGTAALVRVAGAGEKARPGNWISARKLDGMLGRLARDGMVLARAGNTALDMPERRGLLRAEIGWSLAVPLRADATMVGWLAFTRSSAAGRWPKLLVRRAILVGELFASALVRQRAEAERERLFEELLRAEQETQRRIARSLHDGTAQNLVAATLELEQLERTIPESFAEARARLGECRSLCTRSLREIRTLSHFLDLPELEGGLPTVLGLFVDQYSRRSGIAVELDVSGALLPPSARLETVLFLAARELLANVHRHSGSATAAIRLATDQEGVSLEVLDHGRGMGDAPPGTGLCSIRERLQEFRGDLAIRSSTEGTSVIIHVPWTYTAAGFRAANLVDRRSARWAEADPEPASVQAQRAADRAGAGTPLH